MSDFSDAEDRMLCELVRHQRIWTQNIDWKRVTKLMEHTGKSRQVLRQRLKTLKRRYGKKLEKFPARWASSRVLPHEDVYKIVERIFSSIEKMHVHQSSGQRHLNVGEISMCCISTLGNVRQQQRITFSKG